MRARRRSLLGKGATTDVDLVALRQHLRSKAIGTMDRPARERFERDLALYRQACDLEVNGTILGLVQAAAQYQELVEPLRHSPIGTMQATLCDACLEGLARATESLRTFLPKADPSYARAIGASEELVRRHPHNPAAVITLARLLLHVGRAPEALRLAEGAVPDSPGLAASRSAVMASAYLQCGELDGARESLRQQLQQLVVSEEQRGNAALSLLLLGEYKEGWSAFRALKARHRTQAGLRQTGPPEWEGREPDGHVLLLLSGGPGDVFMLARWIPMVQARVEDLMLVVSTPLAGFCASQFPGASIVLRQTLDTWLRAPGEGSIHLASYTAWADSWALPELFGVTQPDDGGPYPTSRRRCSRSGRSMARCGSASAGPAGDITPTTSSDRPGRLTGSPFSGCRACGSSVYNSTSLLSFLSRTRSRT
jgi:hypothetical protein